VTASPQGFFVNASRDRDSFDPRPSHHPHESNTLLDLLRKVSPAFEVNYKLLLAQAQTNANIFDDDPSFLALPWAPNTAAVTTSSGHHRRGGGGGAGGRRRRRRAPSIFAVESDVDSWVAPPPAAHTFDLNRSEESLRGFGVEQNSFEVIRDWNEEYVGAEAASWWRHGRACQFLFCMRSTVGAPSWFVCVHVCALMEG
jgi:hypothetical protein